MEWVTYTPDGRHLRIERGDDGRWHVGVADGRRGAGTSLVDALTRALGDPDVSLLGAGAGSAEVEWIRTTAGQIEAELGDRH